MRAQTEIYILESAGVFKTGLHSSQSYFYFVLSQLEGLNQDKSKVQKFVKCETRLLVDFKVLHWELLCIMQGLVLSSLYFRLGVIDKLVCIASVWVSF